MKFIGAGAAGNKAVVNLVMNGIIKKDDAILVNSTGKDFPDGFESRSVIISDIGGCGKERSVGKEVILKYIQGHASDIVNWFDETDAQVKIYAAMGGGTGSGVANILGDFCYNKLNLDVEIIAIKGFGEDVREHQNATEFLQELDSNFTIQTVDNAKFMKAAGGNKIKAEQMANDEICKRTIVTMCSKLRDSDQNIDETDRYKLVTNPGYELVEYTELDDIKNEDQFARAIKDMIDNSKSLPTAPSCTCLGIMLNVKKSTLDYFDFKYTQLKETYGNCYEVYLHVQEPMADEPEWMAVVSSGMKLPLDAVKAIYDKYMEETQKVDKTEDPFFSAAAELKGMSEDNRFDRGSRRRRVVNSSLEIDSFLDKYKNGGSADTKHDSSNGKLTTNVSKKF